MKSTNSEGEHVEELFDEEDFNFELEENEDLKQIDDDDFNICCENNDYKVHQCKEDLMILLNCHSLAPSIFNEVMQWAKSSLASGHNFNSVRYKTVMKNMCVRFSAAAGGLPVQEIVHGDNHPPTHVY